MDDTVKNTPGDTLNNILNNAGGGKVFLHSCCGPCTVWPLAELRREGFEVQGYFYNPNIHPYREFAARREAYGTLAAREGLSAYIETDYGLACFMEALKSAESGVYRAISPERCRVCYRLRLEKAAAACRRRGVRTFTTTLLVSPYQNHEMIREEGEAAAAGEGVAFLYRDFRPGFRRGQATAREAGLYMQSYCGCIFSEYERYGGKDKQRRNASAAEGQTADKQGYVADEQATDKPSTEDTRVTDTSAADKPSVADMCGKGRRL